MNAETEVRPLPSQPKHCHACNTTKDRSEFNKHSNKKDGLQSRCRQCQSDHARDYFKNHPERLTRILEQKELRRGAARNFVRSYLQSHPCVDCGEKDWVVLEFDHVTGKKKLHVSLLIGGSYNLSVVKEEIAKCEVRCANCHRRATYRRAGQWRIDDNLVNTVL